jgi:hypothetical protein
MGADVRRRTAAAVKMAFDERRLWRARPADLVGAAVLIAHALVELEGAPAADVLRMLDSAGRAIAAEMRRRQTETTA